MGTLIGFLCLEFGELLVMLHCLRQYRSRQVVPVTQGLAECEFSYEGKGYKKKAREIANAWN
ncbi:hypothetical protein Goklo_029021 [Gossypium klotzschianum]|nr:hypothetical protein [Gossypium klotzschianum]